MKKLIALLCNVLFISCISSNDEGGNVDQDSIQIIEKFVYDTVVVKDTTITEKSDTIVTPVLIIDTLLRLDTLILKDTVPVTDTVTIQDTTTIIDTVKITIHDTVYIEKQVN